MEQRQLFAIDGLFCAGCARGLERQLLGLDGVSAVGVHFVTSSALVRWQTGRCDISAIGKRVAEAGYRLIEQRSLGDTAARFDLEIRRLTIKLAVAVVLGMWSMGAALILYAQPDVAPIIAWWIALASGLFALPVLFFSGGAIFRMAWRSIRLRAPGLDLLIAIGATGAVAVSVGELARGNSQVFFDTATMLVTLLLVGRLIETRVRRNAILALSAIDDIAAGQSAMTVQGAIVAVRALAPGMQILVDAGAVLCADGIVIAGHSMLDRAVMTGESVAIATAPGDRVQAGTSNLQRRLTIAVDRTYGDRDIDRMGGRIAIEIAARGEPPRELDRWIGRVLMAMPLIALVTAVTSLAVGATPIDAITRALAALIVFCPCALSIAAPLVHVRAAIVGARQGIMIADPAALEALATMQTVIFDKTGTLTQARLRIDLVEPCEGWDATTLLAMAAEAEQGIAHPIAKALAGRSAGATGERLDRGARTIDREGRHIRVISAGGNREDGRTWLDVLVDGAVAGSIGLGDTLEPGAARIIARLKGAGIVVMLATGDAMSAAQSVARATGILEKGVFAGCTPADKARLVTSAKRPVIVVGDGVNDAPALAAADCGITVARAHSAAAATAGLVFERGGVEMLIPAWDLAQRTRAVIRQNFALAIGYNIVALPLAAFGLLTPLLAAAAMVSSSCFVTLNALRLREAR